MHAPSGWGPLPDVDLIAAALPEHGAPYGGASSRGQGRERDWGGMLSEGQSGSGAEAARRQGLVSSPSGVRLEPMQQAPPRSAGNGMNVACAGTSNATAPREHEWVGRLGAYCAIYMYWGPCSKLSS